MQKCQTIISTKIYSLFSAKLSLVSSIKFKYLFFSQFFYRTAYKMLW